VLLERPHRNDQAGVAFQRLRHFRPWHLVERV
jgi:hypothetical protein